MTKKLLESIKTSLQGLKHGFSAFIDSIMLRNVKCTCESITWGDYMKVICYDRFQLMLKTNIHTPKRIIMQGFAMLLDDYNTITTNISVRVAEENRASVLRLSQRQRIIYACYTSMRFHDLPHIRQTLCNYFIISLEDPRSLVLEKCVSVLKGLDLQISTLQVKTSKEDHKKPMMSDYQKERQILSQYQGYNIPDTITMSEYAVLQNLYRDHVENLKKQHDGTRNH